MKHVILILLFLSSVLGFSQKSIERTLISIEIIFSKIKTAEDAKFYHDSLQTEYERQPFHYIFIEKHNIDKKVDGRILINDIKILQENLSYKTNQSKIKQKERLDYKRIVDKADLHFAQSDYSNAYKLYRKASELNPRDKYVSKQMKKSKKLLK
jgi:hypothetical protein